jgi:probable DNA repair protein|tara:strand:- start:3873 stop:6557 length:2685 start_codon:yes stop_codon:yes gene_type:complete
MDLSITNISGETTLLLPIIEQGGLILTPNRRLSRRLMADIEGQLAIGAPQTWQTPRILPIDTWVNQHWQQLMAVGSIPAKQLLTKQQDLCLWEQCIAQSKISQTLLRPASAASKAQEAYQLTRSWLLNIDEHKFEFGLNEDSETWLVWYQSYLAMTRSSDYIAFVDASVAVAQALASDSNKEPQLVLAGFEAPSPLQLKLVGNASAEVIKFSWRKHQSAMQIITVDDKTAEITQAAHWAKATLDANPGASIAVIAQDLNASRKTVDRIFTRVFKPSSISVGNTAITDSFDMSAGSPLAETPVVAAALQALRAVNSSLDQDQWGGLLTSPYVGAGNQSMEREALLARLIATRNKDSYLAKLRSLAQRFHGDEISIDSFCELLLQLSEAQREIKRGNRLLTLKQWGDHFQQLLKQWNWPGSRSPSSDEYQQIKAFEEAVESFISFDLVLKPQPQAKALELFERHLRSETYHRQTSAAQVQVLGGLEGSGQTFDYLWLMGMNDRQWPASPNPNPLLPKALQQQLAMPNASLEREFDYSRNLTKGYLTAASEIVVSYPAAVDDVACKLSPLIEENKSSIAATEPWQFLAHDPVLDAIPLEQISDQQGISLVDETPRGGAGLLKDQAHCPFKAYAQYRLNVRPLEEPVSGIDPRERGVIVHRALEVLWQELKDSTALAALDDAAKQVLIESCAQQGMEALRNPTISLRLKQLEQQRLVSLLTQWLEVEGQRGDFSVVATEEKQTITIGSMSFDVRLDRLDKSPTGETLVVDYKTGSVNINDWLSERPLEPQLPMYLQSLTESDVTNSGLAVASLKAGNLGYKGISATALGTAGISTLDKVRNSSFPDWDNLIQHWRVALLQLVTEIGEGYASVSPINVAACSYCGLQPLCRIDSAEQSA